MAARGGRGARHRPRRRRRAPRHQARQPAARRPRPARGGRLRDRPRSPGRTSSRPPARCSARPPTSRPSRRWARPRRAASDRYALAVVAYELLTGSRPFEAEHFAAQARAHVEDPPPPASARAPELSRAVDAVLERGLAKEPGDRWPSATAFVDALERTVGEAPAPEPTRPTRRLFGGAPRRRAGTDGRRDATGAASDGRPPTGRRAAPRAPPPAPPRAARRCSPASRRSSCSRSWVRSRSPAAATVARPRLRAPNRPRARSRPPTRPRTPLRRRRRPRSPRRRRRPSPTPSPSPQPTEAAPSGEPDLAAARALQLEGFNARRAGDYETALAKARAAQQACGSSKELSPCGYALFEEGAALNALGQPEAAIPILERRLAEYGDNERGEVERELRDARKKAAQGASSKHSRRRADVRRAWPSPRLPPPPLRFP